MYFLSQVFCCLCKIEYDISIIFYLLLLTGWYVGWQHLCTDLHPPEDNSVGTTLFAGILCDHYLQKMSEFIGEEWHALGRSLCVPERDLRLLRIDYKDRTVRNFKLLDTFRFSRIAIEQGTSVIRFLLRACKSAGCTGGLITFIRYIAGIFKELTFMRPQSWVSMSSAMPSVEIT